MLPHVQGLRGSQRDVLRFVFVLKSRNTKRKINSSYFLVKSELLNAFPSYIPLPVAVAKMLRGDLWIKLHPLTLGMHSQGFPVCSEPRQFESITYLSSLGKML